MLVIKKSPRFNFGAKNTFLVYLLYLSIHLELSAHILTQGISWDELEPFGGFFHFGLGGSIFGAKNCDFHTFAISLECRHILAAVRRGGQYTAKFKGCGKCNKNVFFAPKMEHPNPKSTRRPKGTSSS